MRETLISLGETSDTGTPLATPILIITVVSVVLVTIEHLEVVMRTLKQLLFKIFIFELMSAVARALSTQSA